MIQQYEVPIMLEGKIIDYVVLETSIVLTLNILPAFQIQGGYDHEEESSKF